MVASKISAGAAVVAFLALAACSKTEDTSPETRAFGQPPVIKSASITARDESVQCDFTNALNASISKDLSLNVQVLGTVLVGGTYTELLMTADVVDPDSVPGPADDVLLVAASYVISKQETTLALFDDGSSEKFTITPNVPVDLNCPDPFIYGVSECDSATFDLVSGDDPAGANNGLFTRKFALVNLRLDGFGEDLFQACAAKQKGEFPQGSTEGDNFSFRIDAVDKAGNLTTYPTNLDITVGKSTFLCQGDDCLCCYLKYSIGEVTSPDGRCRGLAGLEGPDAPAGLCNSF